MAEKSDSEIKKEIENVVNWLEKVWLVVLSFLSAADPKEKRYRRLSKIDPPIEEAPGELQYFGDWLLQATKESESQEDLLEDLTFVKEIIRLCGLKPLKGSYLKLNQKNRELIEEFRGETDPILSILRESKTFLDVVTGKNDSPYGTVENWYESWVEKHMRQLIRRQEGDEPPVIE